MFFARKVEEIDPDVGHGCAEGGGWGFHRAGDVLLAWPSFLALVTAVYHGFYIIGHSLPEVELVCQCQSLFLPCMADVQSGQDWFDCWDWEDNSP